MNDKQGKQVSREELYEHVWKTPMTKLAEQWGVSIPAIVKACAELDVPRPGHGHWSLVQRGWKAEPDPLPSIDANQPQTITIAPPQIRDRITAPAPATEKPPGSLRVKVPGNLTSAHDLVRETYKALTAKDTYTHNGVVQARATHRLRNISVSPQQVERACRIMAAVIAEVVKLGWRFERGPEPWRFDMFLNKQPINFGIKERMKRRARPMSEDERNRLTFSSEKYEWYGSGFLRFWIRGENLNEREWEEGKRTSLELQLDEIIEAFSKVETEAARNKAQKEVRRREEEKQRAKEYEIYRRQQLEEGFRKQLEDSAKAWTAANQLRGFIGACEDLMRKEHADIRPDEWQGQWLAWARQHADRIDPLNGPFLAKEKQRLLTVRS